MRAYDAGPVLRVMTQISLLRFIERALNLKSGELRWSALVCLFVPDNVQLCNREGGTGQFVSLPLPGRASSLRRYCDRIRRDRGSRRLHSISSRP